MYEDVTGDEVLYKAFVVSHQLSQSEWLPEAAQVGRSAFSSVLEDLKSNIEKRACWQTLIIQETKISPYNKVSIDYSNCNIVSTSVKQVST
ncbi:hypothetical protein RRG08_002623 [Elysia crispata]|uniref:Uncharacterized protein n=1 Tax=Elysia crispata TaxID=231223 RepID=A0AAE0Y4P7_9GAST|nr:hypothetical protein RRG08_002623 [Elysia crispata]